MSYQINKTDGTIIASVPDGQVDTLSTDLTLIGKNYSNYGDALNENFVKLLENFADTKRPTNPIIGQLWYDTTETTLKIYSGTEFVPVSSTTISDSQPAGLRIGDLWFDNSNKQLNFYDGSNLVLISPIYTASQGKSGFVVDSILDTQGQTRIVTYLYNGGALLGIFAKDSFTPAASEVPPGFSGTISPGFNASDIVGLKFNVTCSAAEALKVGNDIVAAEDFLRTDAGATIDGQLHVNSNEGIVIGTQSAGLIAVQSGKLVVSNFNIGQNISFTVTQGLANETALDINPNTRTVNLYEEYTDSTVYMGGSLTVNGDLTVSGTTTTISAETLQVEDKNIEVGYIDGSSETDVTAEGGGITIKGDADKSLIWNAIPESLTTGDTVNSSTGTWTSTEHFNLGAGQHYAINGYPLIQPINPTDPATKYKLSDHITEIDGISVFGKRENLKIGPAPIGDPELLRIEDTTITTYSGLDLNIAPSGNIVCSTSPVLKGLGEPTDAQDAATKNYVDTENKLQTIFLSTTLTDPSELTDANFYNLLNTMIPVGSVEIGTLVKMLTTVVVNDDEDINPTVNVLQQQFLTDVGGSTSLGVTAVTIPTTTVPGQSQTITRYIKTFQYQGGGWNLIADDLWTP